MSKYILLFYDVLSPHLNQSLHSQSCPDLHHSCFSAFKMASLTRDVCAEFGTFETFLQKSRYFDTTYVEHIRGSITNSWQNDDTGNVNYMSQNSKLIDTEFALYLCFSKVLANEGKRHTRSSFIIFISSWHCIFPFHCYHTLHYTTLGSLTVNATVA